MPRRLTGLLSPQSECLTRELVIVLALLAPGRDLI
jgi:hypothetical protein